MSRPYPSPPHEHDALPYGWYIQRLTGDYPGECYSLWRKVRRIDGDMHLCAVSFMGQTFEPPFEDEQPDPEGVADFNELTPVSQDMADTLRFVALHGGRSVWDRAAEATIVNQLATNLQKDVTHACKQS